MKRFLGLLIVFFFLFFNPVLSANSFCIDINTASIEELREISGIGPVLAQRIIDARPFSSIDELLRVSGIAEKKLSSIKEENLACVQPQPESRLQPQLSPELQNQKQPENNSQEQEKLKPKIALSYPEYNPINKEIEIILFIVNLKEADYDVKISIEREKTISNTYNKNEDKWHSSRYYLNSLFFGSSFEHTFYLKIREEYFNFEGQASLLVRVRESGKSAYLEQIEKININKPELQEEKISENKNSNPTKGLAAIEKQIPGFFSPNRPFLTALGLAVFFAIIILILKKKLKTKEML